MSESNADNQPTAILAADVAGFTRLVRRDEAGTVAALDSHRSELIAPCITDNGGSVIKTTGDGLFARFAGPVDAVRCALAIQKGMAERNAAGAARPVLWLRIGVSLGEVIERDGDILGDAVNLAAHLEELAEPGGICVAGDVREQARRDLTARFEGMGRVEIPSLAGPVRVFRVSPQAAVAARPRRTVPWRKVAAAAAVVLVVGGAAGAMWWFDLPGATAPAKPKATAQRSPETPAVKVARRPTIAVLPLANSSGDPGQEYFALGMTEDLVTGLRKLSGATVRPLQATIPFKGRKASLRYTGRKLGVRYVITGSAQRSHETVRIEVQLGDANTGARLWSEVYEGRHNDVFALEDRVLRKVIETLTMNLTDVDLRRLNRRATASSAAHDLYLRGRHRESLGARDGYREAAGFYEQALAIDANYPLPYFRLADILELSVRQGWTEDARADLEKAVALAEKALALDADDPRIYWSLGRAASRLRTPEAQERGLWALSRVVQLSPNFADAHALLGVMHMNAGRARDGLRSVETAMRFNRRYPSWYLHSRGMAHYLLEDYPAAIEDFTKAAKRDPNARNLHWWLAAAYAQAGNQNDASTEVERLRALGFAGNLESIVSAQPIQHPAHVLHIREGLAKAGIPE